MGWMDGGFLEWGRDCFCLGYSFIFPLLFFWFCTFSWFLVARLRVGWCILLCTLHCACLFFSFFFVLLHFVFGGYGG